MTTDSTARLSIVIASTRPGRVGGSVGQWVNARATSDGRFDARVIDLAELDLPLLDEPHHPRLRNYTQAHTRHWSDLVENSDAFIFVVPEYNSGYNAALKNAFDFLFQEWHYKPVAFVSYGGLSAGMRAVQQIKQVASALRMVPLVEGVAIPFVHEHVTDGDLVSTDAMESAIKGVFEELGRWSAVLAPMRVRQD